MLLAQQLPAGAFFAPPAPPNKQARVCLEASPSLRADAPTTTLRCGRAYDKLAGGQTGHYFLLALLASGSALEHGQGPVDERHRAKHGLGNL